MLNLHQNKLIPSTFKSAHAVISIKQSPVLNLKGKNFRVFSLKFHMN